MEQEIRFCTAPDGVRIAYATVGEGSPLVKAANWLSHLEYDWDSPVWRHWWKELARGATLVRYDERGCGLSDWKVEDFSLNTWVQDLETVVDALDLERFPLLGISQGGPVAITYAVRYPEKVSHLILYGTYSQGRGCRKVSPDEAETSEALSTLMKIGWGKDNPAFRQVFSSLFMPEATTEQMQWFTDLQRITISPQNAVRFHNAFGQLDVLDLLPDVKVPTLVLHARDDASVPVEAGRQLAARISGARFVLLDGKNHILLESEPAWQRFVDEVQKFIGIKATVSASTPVAKDVESLGQASSGVLEGQMIAHYQILEKIGGGGMGLVYQASDQRLDRLVALKFLPPFLSMDEEAKPRFIREAKAASALDHPNICTIYDVGETDDGQLFIAMAYYKGETLAQKIARGPLPVEDALNYSMQVAGGLSGAHEAGIVHRDIKPANVMVTESGSVKLLDFGVAKIVDLKLTRTGTTLGTVAYMSPEQSRGEAVDGRTDLWSTGVVMYEMLTGEHPFKGESELAMLYEIIHEEPTPVRELCKKVPDALARIVDKLLLKDPDERYQEADELLSALQKQTEHTR